MAEKDIPVTLIVQQVHTSGRPTYRLVVYGDARLYRPMEFLSLAPLITKLQSAIPNFDESTLSPGRGTPHTQIIFTAGLTLSEEALIRLGVVPRC